ncbi:hypothetical protein GCM10027592_10260 [Spirosoma flavus]
MKNYIISTAIGCLLAVTLPGCQEDLLEKPKTFVSPNTFFANADGYEQVVKGIYSTLPSLFTANGMMMREMFSDYSGSPSPSYEQALPTYQNNHQPFFYNVRGEWANEYTIIKNANFILSYLDPATNLTATKKKELTAEARFLRAFAYFQLVQFFGDLPIRTTPLSDYSQAQAPRSSQADVYKLILDDLTYAEANLPEQTSQQGRVYKLVATAQLAKVYLTMAGNPLKQTQYFQNAREKALAVINSGKFQLVSDYAQLFHSTAYTTESIWEQLFRPEVGGNGLQALSSTAKGFVPILLPSSWFINSFAKGDQRKEWGIKQSYKGPDGATLAPFYQKFVNTTFIDAGATPSGVINGYTVPFLRLGEIYLIAAEAENEISGPANAYQYINRIRQRARVNKSDPTNVPDLANLSKEQFREAVYMERKWELHEEGSAWFDLKRTGTLTKIQTIRSADLVRPIGTYNDTWYIPDNEIQNNTIPQNPSYGK